MQRKRSKLFGQKHIRAVLLLHLVVIWITTSTSLADMPLGCAMQMVTGCHQITVVVK